MTSSPERQLGVDLFNGTWTLLENTGRTREDDDVMLHRAHASAYHWSQATECRPENRARSEWLCSRVYAVLGRAEPALHHAQRCLDLCEEHGIVDWDVAFAYEALARASRAAGDTAAAAGYVALADQVEIAGAEDRELLASDLAALR